MMEQGVIADWGGCFSPQCFYHNITNKLSEEILIVVILLHFLKRLFSKKEVTHKIDRWSKSVFIIVYTGLKDTQSFCISPCRSELRAQ